MRVEKDTEHESQGYTTGDRCIGITPIKLRNCLKEIGIETQIIDLRKTVFLHTTRILQKVQGSLLLLDLENINPLLKQCVK